MFNFTTTTVVNSLKDFTTGKDLVEKKDGIVYIKRHNPFVEDNIVSMIHSKAIAPKNAEVKIADLVSQSADKRIELYIRSVGNADPMFANAMLHKGKPLFIEVPQGTVAADLVKVVNKYNNLMFGGDNQLVAEMEGTQLVLKCTNPYQTITKAVVAARDAESGEFVESQILSVKGGHITPNEEGFGDYDHIMKDLRLPTSANLRWKRTMEDEMPVAGASYDQFILVYRVDRGVMGLGAVGAVTTSETTHVFWVKSDIAADFAAKFTITETRNNTVEEG